MPETNRVIDVSDKSLRLNIAQDHSLRDRFKAFKRRMENQMVSYHNAIIEMRQVLSAQHNAIVQLANVIQEMQKYIAARDSVSFDGMTGHVEKSGLWVPGMDEGVEE